MITSEAGVLAFFDAGTRDEAERAIYKSTECGAWLKFSRDGVSVGSIVEGSDAEAGPIWLGYADGFTKDDLQLAIDEIESVADVLWIEANVDEGDEV